MNLKARKPKGLRHDRQNRIMLPMPDGVMVSVLASKAIYHEFEPTLFKPKVNKCAYADYTLSTKY